MAGLSREQLQQIVTRVQAARIRLLNTQPFYAVLLMYLKFAVDFACPTLYTDGERIAFNPYFLEDLTDSELEFALMHETLHVALGHCRTELNADKEDHDRFNVACDIVINSNVKYSRNMDPQSITLRGKEAMHTVGGKEGYLFDAEEVYKMLPKCAAYSKDNGGVGSQKSPKGAPILPQPFDDHSFWKRDGGREDEEEEWKDRMVKATELAKAVEESNEERFGGAGCGKVPATVARLVKKWLSPQTDWRTLLANFVQEEINDYSFSPPDRRYDGPFFLPDLGAKEDRIRNVVFLVDTSGSMTRGMIERAFSEIKGAIEQFDGRLTGFIGAGDTQVRELIPFDETASVMDVVPVGGGGTDFEQPIRFVIDEMRDEPPSCIVYVTDGYCDFPPQSITQGVPLLWLITTDVKPPWGRVAYVSAEDA